MAVDLSDLDRFDAERPAPPAILYKYVVPARVDVLRTASIRFTPPLNTNDIFEIRQSFDLIVGPKMQAYLKEMAAETDYEESLRNALDESGLDFLANAQAQTLFTQITGEEIESAINAQMKRFLEVLPALMNAPDRVNDLLERLGATQQLLSLSERPDSSPMWAHYADNSKGFVIAFDTSSPFFRRGKDGELQGLHKVRYFDGRVGEILDDPFAALVSKQADWSHEREWRLYARDEDVSKVVEVDGETIHLVSFPRDAITRVILGLRVRDDLEAELRGILESDYPGVALSRLKADRATAMLTEEPA